ncbi:MAG TPA: acetyl-CoA decarbonylase/synthase complex subunit gamma [Firmicutes bacterium]|nr:acetyl-CoA decarbonylase/synthase complex subunit gamma [Bacillota bacterium]
MGLTGLEIFKQLPKKNCGECGSATCLAFAMALANGKANLDNCPYISAAARENLEMAAAPPIKLIKVGTGEKAVELGDETELFRHDKKFYHPAAVAVLVSDEEDVAAAIARFNELEFERAGLKFGADMAAVKNDSGDGARFRETVETVMRLTAKPLILIAENVKVMTEALKVAAERRPLLYAATADNYREMAALAGEKGCPLAVKGCGLEKTAELAEKIVALGFRDLVLDSGARETARTLADLTQIRRLAVKKRFRPLGFPSMAFTSKEDPLEEITQAGVYLTKYASIVVVKTAAKQHLFPLLSWRQDLYTDPQKPAQVEAKLYEIGQVKEDSPLYITTNFSLTYYIVAGEVEASKIPSYILVVDTDGVSVLTAWAAGKLTGEAVAQALKRAGIAEKLNHRKVIIPGYVAVLSGPIEEASGWEVIVGPREAAGIPKFAKTLLSRS